MTTFDKAWNVVKADDYDEGPEDSPYAGTSKCPCRQGFHPCDDSKCAEWHSKSPNRKSSVAKNERFGEKFNRKLDSLKEGARGVPEKFSNLKPTTGEDYNRKVMANILETDNDGIEDEYGRLKDMFDNEPGGFAGTDTMEGPSMPDSSSQALGSKGLIERFKRAGPTPRGPVKKMNGAEDFVEEVRDLVEQGMPVMEAVQQVSRLVGCKGRELMRAYVEAYR